MEDPVIFGRDYLGSTFVSNNQVLAESKYVNTEPDTILGRDYLGSTFVAKKPKAETNFVLGKDYLGSTFVSCLTSDSTGTNQHKINSSLNNYILGKDYLGSTFVSSLQSTTRVKFSSSSEVKTVTYNENRNHEKTSITLGKDYIGSTFVAKHDLEEAVLQEVAANIVKDCVTKASDKFLKDTSNKGTNEQDPKKEDKEEELDILGNGLLRKITINKGEGIETRPERGQEVTIRLETSLKNGTIVESCDELQFVLADKDVPDAIDLAVNLMEKNEQALIISDAKYAYGEKGKLPNIPPNSDVSFNITLLDIVEGPYNTSVDVKKRIKWADAKREKGNDLYKDKLYADATTAYSKCVKVLEQAWKQEHPDEIRDEIKELTVKCCNNLIVSNMKCESWADALKACKMVEKLDPTNTKALFRKGKILSETGDLKKAVEVLQKASKLSPDNKHIQNELTKLTKKLSVQNKARKEMYQRMMGNNNAASKNLNENPTNSKQKSRTSLYIGGALVAIGAILLGIYVGHR